MKKIELEDDLVDFLLAQEALTGISPSEFLRDAFKRHREIDVAPREQTSAGSKQRSASGQIADFLRILSEIHEKYTESFERIASVHGRARVYFARSAAEIEVSGNSTMPVKIPGTAWWVIGNTSTADKARILARVFQVVGCSSDDRLRWEGEFGAVSIQTVQASSAESEDLDPFRI